MTTTEKKIDTLSDYEAQQDYLNLHKQELIDKLYTPELKQAIQDIEYEFKIKGEAVATNIEFIKAEITAEVLAAGHTLEGERKMVEYAKGREGSWDGKWLKGYASTHPEILAAKKPDGQPSVRFVNKKV